MLIETQQQFENIMADPTTSLSTTIEFPGGTVDWVLNITKPCTIFGDNTIIDTSETGAEVAVTISAQVDISDLTINNSITDAEKAMQESDPNYILPVKTAILLNNVQQARFERIRAGVSNYGWVIKDSMNNEFEECEAYNNGTGVEVLGSSNIIGDIDSYQEFGLSDIKETDPSGLIPGKEYYFIVSGSEYKLTCGEYVTFNNLVYDINNSKRVSDGQVLKADFLATITGGDIRISSLTNASVVLGRGITGRDLFNSINGFDTRSNTIIKFNADNNFSLQSKYWLFNYDINNYYVWYNVNSQDIDPEFEDRISVEVNIDENDTADVVAEKTYLELINIKSNLILNGDTIEIPLDSNIVLRDPITKIVEFQDILDYEQQSDFFEFSSLSNNYYAWYAIKKNDINLDPEPVDPKNILEDGSLKYPELQDKIGIKVDLEVPNFASYSYTDGDPNTPTPNFIKSIDVNASNYNDIISNLKLSVTDKFYLALKKVVDNTITLDIDSNKLTIITDADTSVYDHEDGNTDFVFNTIDGALDGEFEPTFGQVLEAERTDRVHHNTWFSSTFHNNSIGIKLVNANHNEFTNCQVYENTNIGVWQTDVSYGNVFRGEVYENVKYGVRNTDKEHPIDVSQTWWGDLTGPTGGGRGDGDKVSNYVIFEPWLQSGTEPELTYPATRQWIWHMLGYPQVAVELTEEQVTECINVALDKFHYYWQTEPYYWYSSLGHGQGEIELPPEIRKENIIEVHYSPQSDIFAQLSGSGESFFLTYYMQQSGGTFLADFYVAMAYKETFERTLGISPTYEFLTHPDSNGVMKDYVRLYPKPASNSIKVGFKVYRTLSEMEVDAQMWIRKYALTWAKEMLGQVRSKFSSVPGPTGEVTLKGSELIQEALQAREGLINDLIKRSEPLGFSMG